MTPHTPTHSPFPTVALGPAGFSLLQAQELDCQVSVIAPTVNNVEVRFSSNSKRPSPSS